MCCTEVGFLRLTRGRPVARTVVGRAQMRPALDHPAGDLAGGDADRTEVRTGRVERGVARVTRTVPIAGPFPDVADHVVQAVAVRLEAADRRGTGVAVFH